MTLQQVFIRRFALSAVGLTAVLALGGCSIFESKEKPLPCPSVKIDRDTAQVTEFRGGTDISDIVMETEIQGYAGECSVDRETNTVDMTLSVSFLAKLGPAATPGGKGGERTQSFQYFVALPDFFPHPAGKHVFTATVPFPPNVNQVRYRDADVTLHIPLAKTMSSGDARVYIGMQLTDEQLRYNRKNQPQF